MGGSSTPKTHTTTTNNIQNTEPWGAQKPYLEFGMQEAQNRYQSDNPQYYPDSTVVPFSQTTQAGLQSGINAATNSTLPANAASQINSTLSGDYLQNPVSWASALTNQNAGAINPYANQMAPTATNANINAANPNAGVLNQYAGVSNPNAGVLNQFADVQNPYISDQPNAYIDQLTNSISRQVIPSVQSAYGLSGRTGSSAGAQQAIASGIADRLAPYMFSSAENAQNRMFQGGESYANRLYGAGAQQSQNLFGAGSQQAQNLFSAGAQQAQNIYGSGENLANRQFAGGESEAAREQSSFNDYLSRLFGAGESALGRSFVAGESGLDRGLSAYGSERDRQLQATGLTPQIDQTQYTASNVLRDIGAQEEDLSRQYLQDSIDRFNFEQNIPDQKLAQYMSLIGGNYGGTSSGTSTASQPIYRGK